jgi:uncharacterized protein YbaR (Trm112 family)
MNIRIETGSVQCHDCKSVYGISKGILDLLNPVTTMSEKTNKKTLEEDEEEKNSGEESECSMDA